MYQLGCFYLKIMDYTTKYDWKMEEILFYYVTGTPECG